MPQSTSVEWWRPEPAGAVSGARAQAAPDEALDARGRFAYRSLLAFTFVLIAAPQEYIHALAPLRLALIAALAAVAGHLLDAPGRALTAGPLPAAFKIAAALLAWTVLTIPMSLWPGGSVSILTDVFFKSLVVFWLLGRVVNTPNRLQALAWMLSLLTIPLALTGVTNYLSGAFAGGRVVGYSSGLAMNPNDLALTLDLFLPLTMALLLSTPGLLWRALAGAIAALNVVAIVLTFSRGGFVGLAAVAALTLLWLIKRGKVAIAVAALVLMAGLLPFVPAAYVDRLATVSSVDADPTGSAQKRWKDMVLAVEFIEAHPLVGAGLGQDVLALNSVRGAEWKSVHDVYLEYGVDLGLPGLGLFLALLIASLAAAWAAERHMARSGGDDRVRAIAGGVFISLTAFAAAAVFYPVAYHFFFYYLAGLAVAVQTIARRARLR